MAAARSKAPAIGSSQWILQERHLSNDLVAQEHEDFGFAVRNELEWLNEHMAEILAHNGQTNLDVFKTPGKLRGKTPRTTRKKPAEARQPLADLFSPNGQHRPSPAQQSLRNNLQKNLAKARFHVAEDAENVAPAQSPAVKSPLPQPLFFKATPKKEETSNVALRTIDSQTPAHQPAPWSSMHSTQDTVMSSQNDDVFSPPQTQSTQPTQATMSFGQSMQMTSDDERRDTGESFVSAKEAFGSKRGSKEAPNNGPQGDAMDIDENPDLTRSDSQDTVIHHQIDSDQDDDIITPGLPEFPQPPSSAIKLTENPIHSPEHKKLFSPQFHQPVEKHSPSPQPEPEHDDTVVHHEVDDQMDIDDDVRSPSDGSSPVKPLVRKSSLAFAPLPAREPLTAKKSMGNRVSRTSHVDQNKARNSHLGRFTGGKSLGGSQIVQQPEPAHDAMVLDDERPENRREESEPTKIHNKTSTQRLYERINMLKQQNEAPKRISQNVHSQASQSQSFASSFPKDTAPPMQASQPVYPELAPPEQEKIDEDDDDDWISPIRTTAPVPNPVRPAFSKSHSADTRPAAVEPVFVKPISVSNPDLSTVVESTTPAGSPTGKKYMDGPLSASKAKFYSALRAAKEKIIGSSATSAQIKLDALAESPVRPRLLPQGSSEDIFTSPKRNDKAGTSLFSHLRSPSKESVKSSKTTKLAAVPGSPTKENGHRTRSSSERERQREKDAREKETRQRQRADERLKEMRDKEQSKAAAQFQKSKAAASKTPSHMASAPNIRQAAATATRTPISVSAQSQAQSRPGTVRMNTAPKPQDPDSADEMPPPPPPKSLLPTTKTSSKASLREPKKLLKTSSKDALTKAKPPQKIMVNLGNSRYGPAPPPAARPAPTATKATPSVAPVTSKAAPVATKPTTSATTRPPSALSSKSGPSSKAAPPTAKTVPRVGRPQPPIVEKPKAAPTQTRPDMGPSKPLNTLRTVEDANRIKVPAINPAKPAKRPFQGDGEESLHRPAKRPSQQAKMNPITPAHAQFAKGKIPFAEPVHPPQHKTPQPQYGNSEDIKLPEIMTDSEDEDSENEFEQPEWANTPNLRELLASQQLMDPEQIFGPIAPLNMEQVFPNKERHKRFRERTSSAYWANDQVTEEEKRKEREARERLVREGAWTYNPSPRAGPSR